MPYDYHNQSIVNGNMHTLTLTKPNAHILVLEKPNVHTLTLVTPIVGGGGTTDYNELENKPIINEIELIGELTLEDLGIQPAGNYWTKEELTPMTIEDIDIITGVASTASSFIRILEISDSIWLDDDIEFENQILIDKSFTIDLSGQEISSEIDSPLFVVDGSTLTLKGNGSINVLNSIASVINGGKIIIENGTYYSGKTAFNISDYNSAIEFNSGELTASECGFALIDGASLIVNDGIISVNNGIVITTDKTIGHGGNTITINAGALVSNIISENHEACGVYIANRDTFVMNGGTITGNGGCGLLMRAGNIIINNGVITALTGPNVPGYVENETRQMNASAVIYDELAGYPTKAGMSLTINAGQFVGADHSVEVLSHELNPNVTILDGEFIPAYPEE